MARATATLAGAVGLVAAASTAVNVIEGIRLGFSVAQLWLVEGAFAALGIVALGVIIRPKLAMIIAFCVAAAAATFVERATASVVFSVEEWLATAALTFGLVAAIASAATHYSYFPRGRS